MQGVFYWGMRISRNEVYLLWKQLSLNDYSYIRENYMFEILGYDGYIFGEIIYPGEEPVEGSLDIFKVDQSRIISAYDTIAKPLLKKAFFGHNAGENLITLYRDGIREKFIFTKSHTSNLIRQNYYWS